MCSRRPDDHENGRLGVGVAIAAAVMVASFLLALGLVVFSQ